MFDLELSPNYYDAAFKRISVRTYDRDPQPEQLERMGALTARLTGNGARLQLLSGERMLTGPITGTTTLLAIMLKQGAPQELGGYLGEAIALDCTMLGLHTCWLGVNFNKRLVSDAVALQNDESLRCVIAVGQATVASVSHKRKPLQQVCGLKEAEVDRLSPWMQAALRCGRIAPSAINKQPWKLSVDSDSVGVSLHGLNLGYSHYDRGICMLHIQAGASSHNADGVWEERGDEWVYKV